MFSSRSFVVSGLTFRSLIHFEFIFVCGVRKCSIFILLRVTKGGCEIPEALRGKKNDTYSALHHLGKSDRMQPHCVLGNVWRGKGAECSPQVKWRNQACALSLQLSWGNSSTFLPAPPALAGI